MRARYWPVVTIALILTNLISFAVCHYWDQAREQRLAERGITALVYFHQHPYLALKSPLDEFVARNGGGTSVRTDSASTSPIGENTVAAMPTLAILGSLPIDRESSPAPMDRALVRREQAELDSKVSAFATIADQWQGSNLAHVPRTHRWWTLLTYQFMHASWLHLLGNLGFLWFVGKHLERRWGFGLFAAFYLSSGIVAAGVYDLLAWHSLVPLIGASGAIAGLLGAFALQHANTPRRANSWQTVRWRAWQKRAPLLLLVWFAVELTRAALAEHHSGGVAHFAHVGGFAFGLVGAWLLSIIDNARSDASELECCPSTPAPS